MVIWRGLGFLVPVFLVLSMVAAGLLKGSIPLEEHLLLIGCSVVAGVSLFIVGRKLNSIYIEEEKKRVSVGFSKSHSFFFIPMQYWSVLVVIFVSVMSISDKNNEEENVQFIAQPAVDDVYYIDYSILNEDYPEKEYPYALAKISRMNDAFVTLLVGKHIYEKQSGLRKEVSTSEVDDAENYGVRTMRLRRDELSTLYKQGAIYEVERPTANITLTES